MVGPGDISSLSAEIIEVNDLNSVEDYLTSLKFGQTAAVEARKSARKLSAPSQEERDKADQRKVIKWGLEIEDDEQEESKSEAEPSDESDSDAEIPDDESEPTSETSEDELDRYDAIQQVKRNFPLSEYRPDCNKHGELPVSHQCAFIKKRNNQRCKARTRHGAYCWNHLMIADGLRIKKSAIAGKGLFASRPFKKSEEITRYTGDISYDPDQDHHGSLYVYGLSKDVTIDAARSNTAPV